MVGSTAAAAKPASDDLAGALLDATGTRGGLVAHVGCGEGGLTVKLHATSALVVHGLDVDAANVAAARRRIQAADLLGTVSADAWDGKNLPYVDNLVNLLVVEKAPDLSPAEAARVLCPNGILMARGDAMAAADTSLTRLSASGLPAGWTAWQKPRDERIDEWTHFLHGPDNNAVAHDRVVGPPRRLQWVGSPRYGRHHDKMSSISAVVSSGGRVFYIIDEAPYISILMPPQWQLVARDAFNGTVLWRRPIGPWHPHLFGLKSGPAHLPRKLVAVDDTVFLTIGIGQPITALDAATGEIIQSYAQTQHADEFVYCDGVLFVVTADDANESPATAQRRGETPGGGRRVMAVQATSGKTLWSVALPVLRGTLSVDGPRVLLMADDKLVCLDAAKGREQWRSKPLPRAETYPVRSTPTLVLYEDIVLFAGGEFAAHGNRSWAVGKDDTMTALDAATGKKLWSAPHPLSGYASGEDLLVVGGVVWAGETTSGHAVGRFTGRNVRTGKVVAEFDPDVSTYWFHHRCYRGKATDRFLLMSRTGTEFIDVEKQSWDINHWVRGACLYGLMPANGLLYAPQSPCACFLESRLTGFNALAPAAESSGDKAPPASGARLQRGPAYSQVINQESSTATPTDWPTYRGDMARSGSIDARVPAEVGPAWSADIGGRLSAPIVAAGRVIVASIDAHTVHAVDAKTGKPLWQFLAGGRVDSPPTYWQGRVIFGAADGCVYCLRAADGALAWRFRAAPIDRRLMSFEQLESVWPVHGSVLMLDGEVHFVAGRSMFLDGGLRYYRLNARTGGLLSETVMNEDDPGTDGTLQDLARQHNMPVAHPDVLSTDGRLIYMRSQPLRKDGVRLPLKALPYAGNPERYSVPPTQRPEHAHLFSPTGLLDDSWWHRTYWVHGSRFLGGWAGYTQAGKVAPAGRILVTDEENVYGFGRLPQYYRWTTPIEHHLFCAAKISSPEVTEKGGRVVHRWANPIPLFARAMALAGRTLFVAGPRDLVDEEQAVRQLNSDDMQRLIREQEAAYTGQRGGLLWAVSADDGEKLATLELDTIPVFDGMAAAGGRLYLATVDGRLICLAGE